MFTLANFDNAVVRVLGCMPLGSGFDSNSHLCLAPR